LLKMVFVESDVGADGAVLSATAFAPKNCTVKFRPSVVPNIFDGVLIIKVHQPAPASYHHRGSVITISVYEYCSPINWWCTFRHPWYGKWDALLYRFIPAMLHHFLGGCSSWMELGLQYKGTSGTSFGIPM
jgi:hypothetical protein